MGQIEVFSPAKINLFLSVTGRRGDGFHELLSLVAPLDFGDRLHLEIEASAAPSVRMNCSDPTLPNDEKNLAFAAAARFLERFGFNWELRMTLEKRIPHGAGLGGGSSNAAAVLRGLRALALEEGEAGVGERELPELAAELGSDCPLFLAGEPVVMRGRGELLEGLADSRRAGLKARQILLFKPSFAIATGWAYGAVAARADGYDAPEWAEERLRCWADGQGELEELLHNSFEPVAAAKFTGIEVLLRRLRGEGIPCLMSGSGSCCFALIASDEMERRARELIAVAWGERCFLESARIA